jgi:uncharacterized membrane protein YkoI
MFHDGLMSDPYAGAYEQTGKRVTRKLLFLVLGALAVLALTVGVAAPAVDGDDDTPLSGTTLERASQAALDRTGGGKVVDSETGDDGAAYGVEIQLADGSQVEVSLDADFNVVGQETDDDSGDAANSSDDD